MVVVSVNAFDDAELLRGCLASVREVLGNVRIQVIDGRYESFPAPEDNSTDATPQVCDAYGAEYWPDGPFPTEEDKHRQQLARIPGGKPCLLIDTDERLVTFDENVLATGTPYKVRVHNAVVYSEQRELFYYPRYYQPEWVTGFRKTDMPEFGETHARRLGRTDAITIAHRHDFRDRDYREAKLERYAAEGRDSPYVHDPEGYVVGDVGRPHAAPEECPECGEETLYRSPASDFGAGDELTQVLTCTNGECYAAVDAVELGEYRYLPDRVAEGYAENPQRLRLECIDVGGELSMLTFMDVSSFHPALLQDLVEEELGVAV